MKIGKTCLMMSLTMQFLSPLDVALTPYLKLQHFQEPFEFPVNSASKNQELNLNLPQ